MTVRGKKNDSNNRMKHGKWRPVHNNIIFIHVDNLEEKWYLLDKSLVRKLGIFSVFLCFELKEIYVKLNVNYNELYRYFSVKNSEYF